MDDVLVSLDAGFGRLYEATSIAKVKVRGHKRVRRCFVLAITARNTRRS